MLIIRDNEIRHKIICFTTDISVNHKMLRKQEHFPLRDEEHLDRNSKNKFSKITGHVLKLKFKKIWTIVPNNVAPF